MVLCDFWIDGGTFSDGRGYLPHPPYQPRTAATSAAGRREPAGRTPNDAGSPWAVPDVPVDEDAPVGHPAGPASFSVLPRYFTFIYRDDPASVYQLSRGGENIGPYRRAKAVYLLLAAEAGEPAELGGVPAEPCRAMILSLIWS